MPRYKSVQQYSVLTTAGTISNTGSDLQLVCLTHTNLEEGEESQ